MTEEKFDITAFLQGYVAGYWEGWDWALDPSRPEEEEKERLSDSAAGTVVRSPGSPATGSHCEPLRARPPTKMNGADMSSSRSEPGSLPTLRQPASSAEGEDETKGEGES